jgi:nitrite reductase (NADH) large subunit
MQRLVVVGNGMAGIAAVEQIFRYEPRFQITVVGDETHVNYNRILLSSVLAGERDFDDITLNDMDWYRSHNIDLRLGVHIVDVDAASHSVSGDNGSVMRYDKLLLATGSQPLIPPISGTDKDGVFCFRTVDDAKALMGRARPGLRAVVIGGGLLGLEAARGLHLQGAEVTVIHLCETLMERQLDCTGAMFLKTKIEQLGIRVLTSRQTKAILGSTAVDGVYLADGETVPAELVVMACGIRPNVELGRRAGLTVNRGIVVNDYMETSHPDIFAVGECVEHRGVTYGLVAPLYEQSKTLAATITGNRGPVYEGSISAAKLKIVGIDVFSMGYFADGVGGTEAIRYTDEAAGIYKKLVLKDRWLAGVILVGDITDSARYTSWMREGKNLEKMRNRLLFPEPEADRGVDVAQISDSEIVCGCMGVTKGAIIGAIHQKGISTLSQLKEATRASTGCGSCKSLCMQILKAVVPDLEEEKKKVLCACVPFPEEQLREMVRTQQLRSAQEILDTYGNGAGCEVCKPALSYLVDLVWCGEHQEDRSARFVNDRVHANIQRDGTFSVVPRMRGGVTSPAELRRIADVAEKYDARMVKITGSQRIDLLGVRKEDLPKIWAELGMPSGQAYTKGVRMVKTCVGTDFCRFGTQNSIQTGIELEHRLENLYTPHKTKMGVVGCPRNCAEATVKDIGLIGQEGGWQVVVGGAAGKKVRKADLLITVDTAEKALQAAQLFFQYYRENANYLERAYDFVERVGIEKIRKDTVYAPPAVQEGLIARLAKAKANSRDAWLERDDPATVNQFVQIQPLETVKA